MTGLQPRLLARRYELGELIGRGGMADVHAGYDIRLGRDVAIKVLRADLARDSSFLQRFRREAQAAATLSHPNIVAVFDSGEDLVAEAAGADLAVPYIVMERIHGRTLREMLHEDGPFEPTEAARVMRSVLSALGVSHAAGLVHRDIKPANVMVGEDGTVKVMDFGIARAIADTAATMTNTAVVIGTAQYLSPEQAQGREVDPRSDLYAAGCVLFELLTGRPPFVGDSPLAIAYQHVEETPRPPSYYRLGVPRDLDAATLHALEKNPLDRYADADAFALDLDAVVTGSAVSTAAMSSLPSSTAKPGGSPSDEQGPAAVGPIPATDPSTGTLPAVTRPRRVPPWVVAMAAALAVGLVTLMLYASGTLGSAREVEVPSVVGKTQAQALDDLSRAGFVALTTEVASRRAAGTVVGQDPQGKTMRSPNGTITLSISKGPQLRVVPDLLNYDQASARQRLTDLGFTVDQIRTVDSYLVGSGNVVATDPKAGTKLLEGKTVDLIISTGKVKVPDVEGMTEEDARTALNKIGLDVDVTYVTSWRRIGTVLSQQMTGQTVKVGTRIPLRVVKYRPPPTRTVTITPKAPKTTQPDPPTQSPRTSPSSSGSATIQEKAFRQSIPD